MIEFLNKIILDKQGVSITVLEVGLVVLLFFVAIVINSLASRFIRKSSLFQAVELKRKRIIFNVFRLIIWVIVIALSLALVGLEMQKFWNFYLVGESEAKFYLQPKHLIIAFLVFSFTRVILLALERAFSSGSQFREDDRGRSKAVYKFISYLIWVIAVLVILDSTGLNLTIIWGAGAALLVGVGFGLQQIIADLISGIFLLFEGNLHEGDVVELNNGVVGQVEHIGIRTSRILTRDDYTMIIPNTQFIVKEVINWSHNEVKTRFHIDVGVAYGSDTRLVEKVLLHCAAGHAEISENPKPFVRFNNFGDSSLDFQLFFWSTKTFRIENLKSELRFKVDQQFRDHGIQIPFPQRDVHIRTR